MSCKKSDDFNKIEWFLLYAFSIPFACIYMMHFIEEYDNSGLITLVLYGIEGASPASAAILVVLQKQGVGGLKEFLTNRYKDALNMRMCIIGFLVPYLVLTIGKLLTYVTPYHNQFLSGVSSKKILILLWALIAEELGWRGFLQDKIESRVGSITTPAVIGIIWTVWHYHFFLSGSMDVPLLAFTYGCIAESYGYFVITKISKGNIIPASLWHFSGNLFFNLYRFDPSWNAGRMESYMIVNAIYLIYVIAFVVWYILKRRETKDN